MNQSQSSHRWTWCLPLAAAVVGLILMPASLQAEPPERPEGPKAENPDCPYDRECPWGGPQAAQRGPQRPRGPQTAYRGPGPQRGPQAARRGPGPGQRPDMYRGP